MQIKGSSWLSQASVKSKPAEKHHAVEETQGGIVFPVRQCTCINVLTLPFGRSLVLLTYLSTVDAVQHAMKSIKQHSKCKCAVQTKSQMHEGSVIALHLLHNAKSHLKDGRICATREVGNNRLSELLTRSVMTTHLGR